MNVTADGSQAILIYTWIGCCAMFAASIIACFVGYWLEKPRRS